MKPLLYTAPVLGFFKLKGEDKRKFWIFCCSSAGGLYAHLISFFLSFSPGCEPHHSSGVRKALRITCDSVQQSNGCKIIGILVFTQLRLFCFLARPVDGPANVKGDFPLNQKPLGSSADKDDYSIRLHVQSSYAFHSEWKGGNHI